MVTELVNMLLGAGVLLAAVLVLGFVIPYASRVVALIWLQNIRDSIYELVLLKNPWFKDLAYYRLGEVLVTSTIALIRHGDYRTLIGVVNDLESSSDRVSGRVERRAAIDKVLNQLGDAIGEDSQRLEVATAFTRLLGEIEKPLLIRLSFGHFAVIPFGFLAMILMSIRPLWRELTHWEPESVSKRGVVVSHSAMQAARRARQVRPWSRTGTPIAASF